MKRWNKFEQLCPLWWKSRLFRETQTCEVGRNGPSESKLLQVLTTHGRLWQNRSKRFIQTQNVHKAPPKSHNCSSVRPVVSYMLGTLGSNMDASEVKTERTGCYRIYQRFERFVGNAVQTRGWASSRAWTGGQVDRCELLQMLQLKKGEHQRTNRDVQGKISFSVIFI